MKWITEEANSLQTELAAHRRWLHEHAEVGFDLTQTKEYVRRELEQMGIVAENCGKAGLVAVLGNPDSGKSILLRADMDALPIPEESGVDFACPNGNMHACGHDMHTAMLLGAAKLLKNHEYELPGTVKLMFQPAEETFEGAKDMIEHGVLSNPKPDAAVMIHVTAATLLPAGMVIICPPLSVLLRQTILPLWSRVRAVTVQLRTLELMPSLQRPISFLRCRRSMPVNCLPVRMQCSPSERFREVLHPM